MNRLGLCLLGLILAGPLRAQLPSQLPASETVRGGTANWARLRTDGLYWDRHAEYDNSFLAFVRQYTSVNIGRVWYTASARQLDELCTYPFLLVDDVANLHAADERRNFAEYLRRGGFILIDCCCNVNINPDRERFFRSQVDTLQGMLPDLTVVTIQPSDEIYTVYFNLKDRPPQSKPSGLTVPLLPLHGLMLGHRLVGIVDLNGFRCCWAGLSTESDRIGALEMVANIYIYAITHG